MPARGRGRRRRCGREASPPVRRGARARHARRPRRGARRRPPGALRAQVERPQGHRRALRPPSDAARARASGGAAGGSRARRDRERTRRGRIRRGPRARRPRAGRARPRATPRCARKSRETLRSIEGCALVGTRRAAAPEHRQRRRSRGARAKPCWSTSTSRASPSRRASACAVGGTEASPVLLAMGLAPKQAASSLRISVGEGNDARDAARWASDPARGRGEAARPRSVTLT